MTRRIAASRIEIVRAVREAVGPDIQIMIEGHRRFSVAEAIWIGERDRRVRPDLVRGADRPHQDRRHRRGRAPARRPGLGRRELLPPPTSSPSCSKHNTVHILQPDPSNMGGILRTRHGLRHGRRPLRRRRAAPGAGPDLDRGLRPDRRLHARTCSSRSCSTSSTSTGSARSSPAPVVVVDGRIQIPDAPGLGIDVNWAEAREAPLPGRAISCRSSPPAGSGAKARVAGDVDAADRDGHDGTMA